MKLGLRSTLTLFFALAAGLVQSHALDETSAKIILRDGQVEAQIYVDQASWLSTLKDREKWLLGDIDYLYSGGDDDVEIERFLKEVIETSTQLSLNSQVVKLNLVYQGWSDGEVHKSKLFVLYGQHEQANLEQVQVTFPKSLGAVHVSVVKPRYQLLPSGQSATIKITD